MVPWKSRSGRRACQGFENKDRPKAGLLEELPNRRYTFFVIGKMKANAMMLGLVGGLLQSACSLVVSPQMAQCESEQDCQVMGFPNTTCVDSICVASREDDTGGQSSSTQEEPKNVDPRLACKDRVWDAPGEETVKYDMNVADLRGGPYSGLTVKVCPAFDAKCEKPQGEATSDENGNFSLDLPVGFRGHLYAPSPDVTDPPMPVEAYVFPPPSLDPDVPKRPRLVVTQLFVIQGLAALDNANVIPGTGHVIFTVFGCDGKPLEGIEVRTSLTQKETWKVYVNEAGRPDPRLKATGRTGQGAVLNIPTGYVKVIGEHPELGVIFEQSVNVAENRLTSVPVFPSPVPKS